MRRRALCSKSRTHGNGLAAVEPGAQTMPVACAAVKLAHGAANVQTVLDQQGTGRVTHQPDGSIVWEPIMAEGSNDRDRGHGSRPLSEVLLRRLIGLAELASAFSLAMGATVAAAATLVHVDRAYKNGTSLTTGQLTGAVANTVASSFAGLSAGLLLGPVRAATQLVQLSIKPVAAGLLVHRGVRYARGRVVGVRGMVRGLEAPGLPGRLRALASIVARALTSEQFRHDFASCSGFTLLLRFLEDCLAQVQASQAAGPGVLPPPLLLPTVQALEALMRSPAAVDACVAQGGVPMLLRLLPVPVPAKGAEDTGSASLMVVSTPRQTLDSSSASIRSSRDSSSSTVVRSPGSGSNIGAGAGAAGTSGSDVHVCTLKCLSHVSGSTTGRAAIRSAVGIPRLAASLLRATPGSSAALHAAAALSAMAGDDEGKAALAEPDAMAALLVATAHEVTCGAAVRALLACVRNSATSQVVFSKQHGASAALRTCPAARGGIGSGGASTHDVASLLNVLSGFPADAPCNWPAPVGSPLSAAATDEYEMVSAI